MSGCGTQSGTGGRRLALASAAGGALAALLLGGCAPHYMVKSQFVEATHEAPPPEVTTTIAYDRELPRVERVALRAPDGCANRTAAAARGQAASTGRILQTNCGVEMAELERALAAAGYSVASWDAVRNMVEHNDLTPLAAARLLGAQVLFQINSLERSTLDPGRSALWERTFHKASSQGEVRGPASVSHDVARRLEQIVVPAEHELLPGPRLSATVNASAVLVDSGQSIWFYEWTRVEPRSGEHRFQVLVRCDGEACRPVRAESSSHPSLVHALFAPFLVDGGRGERVQGSSETVTLEAQPENRNDVVYHRLVREVVRDLVDRFSGSRRVSDAGQPG